jgi:hypothetical protein
LQADGLPWRSNWDMEDVFTENIVATSMYVYDVENTTGKICLRQETPIPKYIYRNESACRPTICQQDDLSELRFRNNDHCMELDVLAETFEVHSAVDIDSCLH